MPRRPWSRRRAAPRTTPGHPPRRHPRRPPIRATPPTISTGGRSSTSPDASSRALREEPTMDKSRRTCRAIRGTVVASALVGVVGATSVAWAGGPTKEECLDAHSKGQDARESGQLSLARKLFLTCAQPSCPGLVQGDCARFSDELDKIQPTVSFAARDAGGADLPDTT